MLHLALLPGHYFPPLTFIKLSSTTSSSSNTFLLFYFNLIATIQCGKKLQTFGKFLIFLDQLILNSLISCHGLSCSTSRSGTIIVSSLSLDHIYRSSYHFFRVSFSPLPTHSPILGWKFFLF